MKKHRINRILIIYVIISLCFTFTPMFEIPSVRAGSIFYVSTTGNDATGDGSIGNPYATIQKALNVSGDGDTVYLRGGNYNQIYSPTVGLRIRHDDFTLSGYQNEVAVINGDGYSISSSYGLLNIGTCSASYNSDTVTIQNLVIENSSSNGIKVHSCGTGVNDNITISNVTFNNIYLRGFIAWSTDTDVHSINNIEVKDSWFNNTQTSYSMGEGVTFYGCHNVSFHDNLLTNCPKIMLDFANNTKNVVCYNNTFVTTRGTAIKCDGSQSTNPALPCYVSNVSIYNNLFYGTYRAIYIQPEKYGGCDNITIYNNIINVTNSSEYIAAIKFSESSGYGNTLDNISLIYNTIYVRNGVGLSPCLQMEAWDSRTTNITVANNIFQSGGDATMQIRSDLLNSTDPCLNFHNNTYNHTGKTSNTSYREGTSKFEGSAIIQSPEFVDLSAFDFHLNDTSPCINNATSNYTVDVDFDEVVRPQETYYDIGAYESIYIPWSEAFWNDTLSEYSNSTDYPPGNSEDWATGVLESGVWLGQTFTIGVVGPNATISVTNVSIYIKRTGTPHNATIQLRTCTGGTPDASPGGIIATATYNFTTLLGTTFAWHNLSLADQCSLSPGIQYAICIGNPYAPIFHSTDWKFSTNQYDGGMRWNSVNNGSTFTLSYPTTDFLFMIYGVMLLDVTDYSPTIGTENITTAGAPLSVTVNHTEEKNMEVNWYSNSSEGWTLFATNTTTGNETCYQTNTNFSENGTIYYWNVSVREGDNIINSPIYWLKTWYSPLNPTNVTAIYTSPNLNITWTTGKYTDATVVVRNNDSLPTSPTDGYEAYNGTLEYYNDSDVQNQTYFMLYSYNATRNVYSSGATVPWGGIDIAVFNESDNSAIANWDIFVTNQSGSETYEATGLTNRHVVGYDLLPIGIDIAVKISADNYRTRYYYVDLSVGRYYFLNVYLPPENISELYVLKVINQYNQPIEDAKVEIKRYINESVGYTDVSILYTNANGQVSIYLIPSSIYKIIISKTGYITEISDYIPDPDYYGVNYPEEFILKYEIPEPPEEIKPQDIITFNAYFSVGDNNTLYIEFTDSSGNTTDGLVTVFQNGTSPVHNTTITNSSYSFTWGSANHSLYDYKVTLYIYNYSTIGNWSTLIVIPRYISPKEQLVIDLDIDLTNILGENPMGWINCIIFFFGIIILTNFGKRWAGIAIMSLGGILFLFQVLTGLPGFTLPQLAVIPFFLVYGALVEIAKGKKEVRI